MFGLPQSGHGKIMRVSFVSTRVDFVVMKLPPIWRYKCEVVAAKCMTTAANLFCLLSLLSPLLLLPTYLPSFPLHPPPHPPQGREAWDVWCHSPVWILRAVIWFPFSCLSSLVVLPSPVAFSVLCYFSPNDTFTWFKKSKKIPALNTSNIFHQR